MKNPLFELNESLGQKACLDQRSGVSLSGSRDHANYTLSPWRITDESEKELTLLRIDTMNVFKGVKKRLT